MRKSELQSLIDQKILLTGPVRPRTTAAARRTPTCWTSASRNGAKARTSP